MKQSYFVKTNALSDAKAQTELEPNSVMVWGVQTMPETMPSCSCSVDLALRQLQPQL